MNASRSNQGPVHQYLAGDHDRLGRLLDDALQPASMDLASYEAFRAGLLRHIGLEEKLVFPVARRTGDAATQAMISRLHQEHALFAAMLVPTPTVEILSQLRDLLVSHNQREEAPGGMYQIAERIAGGEVKALADQLRAGPEARVAAHFDTALVHENIRALMKALQTA
ncbi:MAG TPA: hemerythrin domain-containing protein [Chloroflexota bacterium]|nr:hemerythrin domain-containing protein [Chloroflexota bacterium]